MRRSPALRRTVMRDRANDAAGIESAQHRVGAAGVDAAAEGSATDVLARDLRSAVDLQPAPDAACLTLQVARTRAIEHQAGVRLEVVAPQTHSRLHRAGIDLARRAARIAAHPGQEGEDAGKPGDGA